LTTDRSIFPSSTLSLQHTDTTANTTPTNNIDSTANNTPTHGHGHSNGSSAEQHTCWLSESLIENDDEEEEQCKVSAATCQSASIECNAVNKSGEKSVETSNGGGGSHTAASTPTFTFMSKKSNDSASMRTGFQSQTTPPHPKSRSKLPFASIVPFPSSNPTSSDNVNVTVNANHSYLYPCNQSSRANPSYDFRALHTPVFAHTATPIMTQAYHSSINSTTNSIAHQPVPHSHSAATQKPTHTQRRLSKLSQSLTRRNSSSSSINTQNNHQYYYSS
jgi:hypothetical protein